MATAYSAGVSSMVAAVSRPRLLTTSFHHRASLPYLTPRPSSLSFRLYSGTVFLFYLSFFELCLVAEKM